MATAPVRRSPRQVLHIRIPRSVSWLYVALVVAVVAGTMLAILAAVRVDIRTDPAGALILMSVCLWIPQQLIVAYCYRRL